MLFFDEFFSFWLLKYSWEGAIFYFIFLTPPKVLPFSFILFLLPFDKLLDRFYLLVVFFYFWRGIFFSEAKGDGEHFCDVIVFFLLLVFACKSIFDADFFRYIVVNFNIIKSLKSYKSGSYESNFFIEVNGLREWKILPKVFIYCPICSICDKASA